MIPVCVPTLSGNELKYVTECIETNWISSRGKFVDLFEDKFSNYCGTRFGISTSNGTTAIHLALVTLGIGRGDEVIVPTFTTVASVNPVLYSGGIPVLVDSEPQTWNIDPEKIEEKITPKTKAIMVVHLYGHPVDMDPVIEIGQKYDIPIIEDAAEAHGAEYKGKKVGGLGDISCFSFYANKIITTGEGGMIVTNNEEWALKAKSLRDHAYGKGEKRFLHTDIGYNYRLTNLQAAIGLAQFEKINEYVNARRRNAKIYNEFFNAIEGVERPPKKRWAKNVYWMYTILISNRAKISRGEVMKKLKEKEIDTRPTFYPIHKQPLYSKLFGKESYPIAEDLGKRGINLPSSNNLKEEEIKYISEVILKEVE